MPEACCGRWLRLAESPPKTPQGKHGDASAEYQLAELQKLKLEAGCDQGRRPGLDPVVWAAFVPEDNKMTPERVELGRKLYFDTRLSRDSSVSCATCHDVTRGFTDQRAVSEGIKGQLGKRNAPTTLNAALLQTALLGRPLADPGPPGQACRSSIRSRWGCPTKRPP